jgi:hypothetical protein
MTIRIAERTGTSPRHAARTVLLAASILLAAILQLTATAPAAYAACSTPVDQVAAMRQASTVFVGHVTAVEDISRKATMRVLEIWKGGDIGTEVVVNGSVAGTPQIGVDDRVYTAGATYLVVPFGSRSPFLDEACSGTTLYSPTGLIPAQYHEALGASEPRIPGAAAAPAPADDSGGGPSLYMLGGAGAVILALLLFTLRRGSQKEPRREVPSAARSSGVAPTTQSRGKKKAKKGQVTPTPAPQPDLDAVAGRKKRKRRSKVKGPGTSSAKRFRRSSGLDNVKAMRKKTRRVKGKKRRKSNVRS